MANFDLLGVATSSLRDQCNVLQVLSRKLKEKRSEAHPERLIGVATTSGIGNSSSGGSGSGDDGMNVVEAMNDSNLIIHNVSLVLPRLHQFAREQPSYFKFFYLSLLLDLLKAAEQQQAPSSSSCPLLLNDLFSYENDGNHQHWLCTHSCCLKLFDLIRFIVVNKETWMETAAYLVLEAGIFVRSIEIQKEEKHVIATVATSKFIDDILDMETITAYLIASLSLLNGLLKYLIALPEQQHTNTPSSPLHQIVQSIGDSLLETIHRVSTGLFINKLSGNDKEFIKTLLFVTEIELRLKHIMNSYTVGTAFHTTCTALCDQMQQVGLNAVSSFVLFLSCISFDVNVLCDYLCSPETPALQYLLRMTKIFYQYLNAPTGTQLEVDKSRSAPRKNIALIHLCTRVCALSSSPQESRTFPPPPTLRAIPRDNDDDRGVNGQDGDAHRVMIWIGKEQSRTVDALPTVNDEKGGSESVSSSSTSASTSTLFVDLPILDRTNVSPARQNLSKDRMGQSKERVGESNTAVASGGDKEPSSTPCSFHVHELNVYDNIVTFLSGRSPTTMPYVTLI